MSGGIDDGYSFGNKRTLNPKDIYLNKGDKGDKMNINGKIVATPPEVGKQLQILSKTELINTSLHSLEDSIRELSSRLEMVLRIPEPENSTKSEQLTQQFVPLAGELNGFYGRITNANETIFDLLQRLEL